MSLLVTLDDIKLYIGIDLDETAYDPQLRKFNSRVSNLVETSLDRTIAATTYTEYFDIYTYTTDRVVLKNLPIISVAAVTDYGSLVSSDKYKVKEESGAIVLLSQRYFTPEIESVEVTYYGGYESDDVPGGIKGIVYAIIDAIISRQGKE